MEILTQTISEQANQIELLKQDNERLAKIVHKDNKLIPAMEYAVYTYLNGHSIVDSETITKGEKLLKDLNKLSEERKGILRQQDYQCRKLISTHVISTDNLLTYMQQKAIVHNIELQTNISCNLPYFTEHIITTEDLNTLLADLLENAIIATKHNTGHYILLSIGIISNIYTISVFDGGIPFTTDVLARWGLERITTHADDGGSGIGLITTYDILNKYHASFIIREYNANSQTFTKEVTISFNNKKQYILQTKRPDEELSKLSKRTDLQIIK